jgi:hypothetical protein
MREKTRLEAEGILIVLHTSLCKIVRQLKSQLSFVPSTLVDQARLVEAEGLWAKMCSYGKQFRLVKAFSCVLIKSKLAYCYRRAFLTTSHTCSIT